MPIFSSILGFAIRTFADFLFRLVEKNFLCGGISLFGGLLLATGSTVADMFSLAFIRFKADVINVLTSWSVVISLAVLRDLARIASWFWISSLYSVNWQLCLGSCNFSSSAVSLRPW